MKRFGILASTILCLAWGRMEGATPPALLNYQGVLRSASDSPLTGTYDMVFRFYDAASAGNEIMIDSHTAVSGGQVTVSGGLFNVQLGGGTITDGAGPGTYTSLANVFRDYAAVFLSVQVAAETLTPRTRVLSAAYAANATHLNGRADSSFLDTSGTFQIKNGPMRINAVNSPPLQTLGTGSGASTYGGFFSGNGTGANTYGGYFTATGPGSGAAYGGYFVSNNAPAFSYGIAAAGNTFGAYLEGGIGVDARGYGSGGEFHDIDHSGFAQVATGNTGIDARGTSIGGYFADSDSAGYAYAGIGDYGIAGYGTNAGTGGAGGYFQDTTSGGHAYVGDGDLGISGWGNFSGGYFVDINASGFAFVGKDTYKIQGTGAVSFVQNHPTDKSKVIVYAAPEADEVATYTRGSARLVGGMARVPLGETFAWVTNPDIGLTAYITPTGGWADLYVESKSPREIVVRSRDPRAPDVTFDYIVFGLRIGFEETSIVQTKDRESPIPSMKDHRKHYEDHPELASYNALERFKRMRSDAGVTQPLDTSASKALHDAIGEYDPAVHGPAESLLRPGTARTTPAEGRTRGPQLPAREQGTTRSSDLSTAERELVQPPLSAGARSAIVSPLAGLKTSEEARSDRAAGVTVRVFEPVEAGDVLVVDREHRGSMRRGSLALDSGLVGIVKDADPAAARYDERAALAGAGEIVPCKVDAAYGAIQVGDLLAVSPTPGHAMRSTSHVPGTIAAKALEDFDSGMGVIQVLVMYY